jgi:hypothetical protein
MAWKLNLNPAHSKMLLDLAAETDGELWWMTTWDEDANSQIGAQIGLPELPVVPCPRPHGNWRGTVGEWKALCTSRWAETQKDRPFVWFDDEWDIPDHLAKMTSAPHHVVTVSERTGLTSEHIEQAREWLKAFAAANTVVLGDGEGL